MKILDWFKVPTALRGVDDAQLAAQHSSLQRQVKRLRLILTLTVLSLIGIFLVASKARIDAIPGDQVASAFEKRADIIASKLSQASSEVLDEVGPEVGDAVGKEAAQAVEDMQKRLDREMDSLEQATTLTFRKAYQREIEAAGADGAKLLQEKFPALKGDEKKTDALLANFQDAIQQWAQKQLVTTFKKHIDAMFRIKATLNRMVREGGPKNLAALPDNVTGEAAKGPMAKVQPERLLEMWIELVSDALGGSEDDGELLEESAASRAKALEAAKPSDERAVKGGSKDRPIDDVKPQGETKPQAGAK